MPTRGAARIAQNVSTEARNGARCLNDERIAYKRGACASMFSPERLYRPESFDPGAFAREAQQALTTSDNRPLDRSGTRERAARAMAASQPYGSLRRIRLRASLRSQEACLP